MQKRNKGNVKCSKVERGMHLAMIWGRFEKGKGSFRLHLALCQMAIIKLVVLLQLTTTPVSGHPNDFFAMSV